MIIVIKPCIRSVQIPSDLTRQLGRVTNTRAFERLYVSICSVATRAPHRKPLVVTNHDTL
jgi:hypothetical protein